jgi:hypothetical protein
MASIHDDEPESDIGYIFRVSGPRKDFFVLKVLVDFGIHLVV